LPHYTAGSARAPCSHRFSNPRAQRGWKLPEGAGKNERRPRARTADKLEEKEVLEQAQQGVAVN
jgi:hypothetical protein